MTESKATLFSEIYSAQINTNAGHFNGALNPAVGPKVPFQDARQSEFRGAAYLQNESDLFSLPFPEGSGQYLSPDESLWLYHVLAIKGIDPGAKKIYSYPLNGSYNEALLTQAPNVYGIEKYAPYSPSITSALVADHMGWKYAGTADQELARADIFFHASHKGMLHRELETLNQPVIRDTYISQDNSDPHVSQHIDHILKSGRGWIGRANISSGGEGTLVLMPSGQNIRIGGSNQVVSPTEAHEIASKFISEQEHGLISQPFIPFEKSPSIAISVQNGVPTIKWGTEQTLVDPIHGDVRYAGNIIYHKDTFLNMYPQFTETALRLSEQLINKYDINTILFGFDGLVSVVDGTEYLVECNARRLGPDATKALAEAAKPMTLRDKYNQTGFDTSCFAASGSVRLGKPTDTHTVFSALSAEGLLLAQDSLFSSVNRQPDTFSGAALLYPVLPTDTHVVWCVYAETDSERAKIMQETINTIRHASEKPYKKTDLSRAAINGLNKLRAFY